MKTLLSLAVAVLVITPAFAAEDAVPSPSPGADQGARTEKAISGPEFAKKAAGSGLAEVVMGRLGVEKGSVPSVRAFGEKMVSDHSGANKELKEIAGRKNIELPDEPPTKYRRAAQNLEKLEGAAFDRAFAQEMVDSHQEAVVLFRRAAAQCTDNDLKSFAIQTLPALEAHLAGARALKAGLD